MHVPETVFAPSDDGGIDDAVRIIWMALCSATSEVAQAAETEWLGPMNPYRLHMKPAAAQLSLPRRVVSSVARRPDFQFTFDGAHLIRTEMKALLISARRS